MAERPNKPAEQTAGGPGSPGVGRLHGRGRGRGAQAPRGPWLRGVGPRPGRRYADAGVDRQDRAPECPVRRDRSRVRGLAPRARVRAGRIPCDRHRSRRAEGGEHPRRPLLYRRRPGRGDRGARASGAVRAPRPISPSFAICDTINICVPTPLRKTKDPDLTYVVSARQRDPASTCGPGQLVILESTTYPGHDRRGGAADARRPPASRSASISRWRSRPSGSIRATRSTTRATSRRWSAA